MYTMSGFIPPLVCVNTFNSGGHSWPPSTVGKVYRDFALDHGTCHAFLYACTQIFCRPSNSLYNHSMRVSESQKAPIPFCAKSSAESSGVSGWLLMRSRATLARWMSSVLDSAHISAISTPPWFATVFANSHTCAVLGSSWWCKGSRQYLRTHIHLFCIILVDAWGCSRVAHALPVARTHTDASYLSFPPAFARLIAAESAGVCGELAAAKTRCSELRTTHSFFILLCWCA